jgi:YVTN family beta-propeller protein
LAFGDGSLWVANSLDGTVSRIDPVTDRVVDSIAVGGAPTSLTFDGRSLWVTNTHAAEIVQVDTAKGRVARRVPLPAAPTGITHGHGAVWVSSEPAGVVFRVAPRSGDIAQTRVGTGPTAIAATADAVWVANTLDGTVSRLDPQTRAVTTTLPVGDGPGAVAAAFGSLWVAAEFDGTVTRIDPSSGRVAQTVAIGGRPQALSVGTNSLWVSLRAQGTGHRGGTLRVAVAQPSLDSIDPAIAYFLPASQLMGITNDGLVTLKHVGGSAGTQLVPDLAVTLPSATNGDRSYRFQLRPGVHYSNGRTVAAVDFRRAIERAFRLRSPGVSLYRGIVGAARCVRIPERCELPRGIVANEAAHVVTFNLVEPDPDFLYKLTLPFAAAIPAGIPDRDVGRRPVPATGPYMIERYVPGAELRMVRNPYFREWSRAAQPDGYVDRIVYRLGTDPDRTVTAIERGEADWGVYFTPFTPPRHRLHEILTRYRDQVHTNPLSQVSYLIMNTREPPFDDVRVRRALNFAIDRNALVDLSGGADHAQPTCQILPPGIPGYRPYCPYTVNPRASGAYSGPDLATAKRLIAASGTRGMHVRLLTDPKTVESAYIVSVLRALGFRATARSIASVSRYNAVASNSDHHVQISVGGVGTDYPAASNIIDTWLSCNGYQPRSNLNNNRAAFCDTDVEAGMRRAFRLRPADPEAANRQWARVDKAIVERAPWLPTINPKTVDFVSQRVGNYQFHPQWGLLLDQLWVR